MTKCNPRTTANDHTFDTDAKIQEHSEIAKSLRFYQGRSQTWLNVTRTMSQSLGISVSSGGTSLSQPITILARVYRVYQQNGKFSLNTMNIKFSLRSSVIILQGYHSLHRDFLKAGNNEDVPN